MLPWREQALKRGYRSSVAFPLKSESRIVGSLSLYASVPSFFDDEEIMLIEALAADLSLAIAVIRQEDERVKAVEALQESEARWQSYVNNAPNIIFTLDKDYKITFRNYALPGYSLADVIGASIFNYLPDESREIARKTLDKVFESGEPQSYEILGYGMHGEPAWYATSVGSIKKDGKVFSLILVATDITDRKNAEEALRESEEWFRTLADSTATAIFIYQKEKFMYVNKAGFDLSGYDKEKLLEKRFWDIVHPEFRDMIRQRGLARQRGESVPHRYEFKIVRRDGSERWVDFTAGFITWKGTPAALGTASDITERKKAEEALGASEVEFRRLSQEFHALLDAIPDNLTLLSPDLKVLWANKGAAVGLNKKPEEMIGASCYSFWYNRKEPCKPCPVRKSFSTGEPAIETVSSQDNRIWELRTIPIMEAGRVVSVIEVGRDISEHRKLEAQYFQAQKMESIGTLAGGVAHDFNNILSAIIGYGHVALMKMAGDDPQRPNIESMLEAADRAAHLTKDLLLFSRKQVSELKPVDLNKVVGQVEKFLKRVIGEDIACKKTLTGHPLTVFADSHQLEQVLMNLATNARDAMPKGGMFTVTTEQIELNEDFTAAHGYGKPGPYAMITVSDTGKGMDEETRKRIFEPFFTTKEVGKGTGLGLAVVYGIIKQHDGFINVYSEPGKGTAFRIYLPIIAAVAMEETTAQKKEAPARGTETVLLAEDDEALRKLSRTVLTQYGYTVIEAVDGEDAVRKFRENKDRIQLLLFDLIMPKMNGKEACDEIRKIRPDMKVLFVSGYAPDIVRQKAALEKGAHLVFKPISPMALLRKVRSVLDGATQ